MNWKRFLFAILILLVITSGIYFIESYTTNSPVSNPEPSNSSEVSQKDNSKEISKSDGSEFLMDTLVKVRVHDENSDQVLEEVLSKLSHLEDLFSKTIDNSDINKINSNAGIKPVKVSEETYDLLEEASHFAKITGGVFDPTIGPLVSLWGIGTEDEKIPTEKEIQKTLEKINYKKIEFKDNNKIFITDEDMSLDLGAIAKGYAADYVINYLNEENVESAFINMGGNVSVHGKKIDGSLWKVGIQDPVKNRGNIIAAVEGKDMSVVTSGNYERYFIEDGVRYHHIINPEKGYPARKGIISSTVISNNSSYADALSTSFYILGIEKSFQISKGMENVNIVLITEDNKAYVSEELKDKITFTVDDLEIIYR